MGSYERALKAYETCYALSPTDEYRICTTDWYCMTLMKMGRIDDMRKAAARIPCRHGTRHERRLLRSRTGLQWYAEYR